MDGIDGMDWYLLILIRCYIIFGLLDVVLVLNILGLCDNDFATLYSPGPGFANYYFILTNRYVPDLNTGCGLDIYKILISSV